MVIQDGTYPQFLIIVGSDHYEYRIGSASLEFLE